MHLNKIFLMVASVVISFLLFLMKPGHAKAPDNVFETNLQNGLQVVVVENHTVPLATIVIAAKNGSYTETPEYNGLSHFYEHMFFKGNKAIPSQEKFQEKIRELGISYNGYTTREAVVYYFTLPGFNLLEGLKFMNNAIRTPLFDAKEIEKEKGAVLGEYDRNESSPYFHLRRAVDMEAYWKYFSRVNVIGEREIIKTVTKEKMVTIQNKYYVPNNCILFVVGDVKHNDVMKLVKNIYSDWKSGGDPFVKYPVPAHPPIPENKKVLVSYKANNPLMMAKWKGPNVGEDNKATFALDVFFTALNIPSSKFQKMLVESGLSAEAEMGYFTERASGEISMNAVLIPEKTNEFYLQFLKELDNMKDSDYITDQEIETAKRNIEINYLYKREEGQDYASGTLGFWWAVSGLEYYFDYINNVKKVTKKDIKEALEKYFFDKNSVTGLLMSKEDQEKYNVKF